MYKCYKNNLFKTWFSTWALIKQNNIELRFVLCKQLYCTLNENPNWLWFWTGSEKRKSTHNDTTLYIILVIESIDYNIIIDYSSESIRPFDVLGPDEQVRLSLFIFIKFKTSVVLSEKVLAYSIRVRRVLFFIPILAISYGDKTRRVWEYVACR